VRRPPVSAALVAGLATLLAACGVATAGGGDGFLRQHCLRCHDDTKQEGGLRIDTLSRDFSDPVIAGRWADLMTRINAGEMPPEEEPRPTADEIGNVAGWIEAGLRAGEAARMAARGRVTFSRLSREEYAHTIHDLLGVRFDVTAPGVMNEDPAWHGFERIGSLLSLSPSHVERYLAAADTIVKRAFPEQEPEVKKTRRDAISLWSEGSRAELAAKGLADKVRVPWYPGFEGWHIHTGAGNGPARVRIQLSGIAPPGGRAPHLSVWDVVGKRTVFDTDVVAAEDKPIVVEFVTMAPTILLMNEVPGKIDNKGGSFFLTTRDHRLRHPRARKLVDDDGNALVPLLLVDWVEVETPVVTEAERQARSGLLPADFANESEVRDCLHHFCERSWRRPVTDAEVDRYVQITAAERAAGEPPRGAFLSAMAAVLASNNFIYLREGGLAGGARLDDWQLASRLSYFLWSSLPDEPLSAAARAGRLHEPAVLKEQLARMLADPKSGRFMESFPRQWLQLQRVGMFPPDRDLYPDYDRWLEKSMVLETQGFFGEILANNLPLAEFLVADWTILNPRLAEHYRLPRPAESGFARVSLPANSHRGGLLTQASVLSLTSDGSRHRPVHRGAWILETILGTSPPPPPPNVEPLEPTPKDASKMTVRMQLADHATNATCASCHRKIDPLGFAFDNFDAVGRWRTVEKVTAGKGDDPPVDASGTLADGRAFAGPDEFKRLLAADIDAFATAFTRHLATYALRRPLTVDDAAGIAAITAACKADGYRLKSLLEALVTSELFLKR
jgi:hypothetical protein